MDMKVEKFTHQPPTPARVNAVRIELSHDDAQRLRAIFRFALKGGGAAGAEDGNTVASFARRFREAIDDRNVGVDGFKDEARALRVD